MATFKEKLNADRRLLILQLLAEDGDYSHNEHVIADGLQMYGHAIGREVLIADLHFLAEIDLIATSEVGATTVARLSTRGLDAARGRVNVPGVARPRPGDHL